MKVMKIILLGVLGLAFFMACNPKEIEINSVEVNELQKYIDEGAVFIDVREYKEVPKFDFPNVLQIPTSELKEHLAEIPKETTVLIYCRSGRRSANTVKRLQSEYGYKNLINVLGGAIAIEKSYPNRVIK